MSSIPFNECQRCGSGRKLVCLVGSPLGWHCPWCKWERPKPDTITIPRDLHELYKEGAEKWAKEQVDPGNGWSYNNEHCCWTCMDCYEPLEHWDKSPTVHAADCKAARILGLKREGAE